MKLKFKKLHKDAKLPYKKYMTDAGYDLYSVSREIKYKDVMNDATQYISYIEYDTGIAFDIPKGYVGLIFPRSSVTDKTLMLKNSVGVIDSGYHDSIKARFYPTEEFSNEYEVGERICQIIFIKLTDIELVEDENFSDSKRKLGGFGHTGSK